MTVAQYRLYARDSDVLTRFSPFLTRLALEVPLFAYGTETSDRDKNLEEIAKLATHFEKTVGIADA